MLIGIIGKARSGKDTFAFMLAKEIFNITRQRYILMAYAHELKLRVQKDFDLSYDQLWGDEKEKQDLRYAKNLKGFSSNPVDYWCPREILQNYGEFYRSINYNFWVDHLFDIIDDKEYKNIVITDIRYPNEVVPVVERSGVLIKIVRDSNEIDTINGQNHISETAMDDYTNIEFIIENNGTLEEFRVSAKEVATVLINKINK